MIGSCEDGLAVLSLQSSSCPKEGAMVMGHRSEERGGLILHSTLTQLKPSSWCLMDFSGRAKHS